MKRQSTLVLVAALALAACSTTVVRESPQGAVRPASTPRYGQTATVQRGDTLYRVATRHGVTVRDIAAWNGIAPPYTIYPGQRLRLYPSTAGAPQRNVAASPAQSRRPPSKTPAPRSGGASTPATKPVTAPAAPTAPPVQSGIALRWPADGTLVNRFVVGDPTRQGIDIAGAGGAPVRAAADGTVVYSGSGLVGYGELVIIKHTDAWLSAYGHNRKRLVNEGQLVKAGEQIAEMGRSGAARDMLHFEVRYNGKPVDPLTHLPQR